MQGAELLLVSCLHRLGGAAEKLADGVYELRAVVSVIQTAWAGQPQYMPALSLMI